MTIRWRIGLLIHGLADAVQGRPTPITAAQVREAAAKLKERERPPDCCPMCGSRVYLYGYNI